ncbi:hypothetical protein MRS44_015269 [Fusarium solani]|uniref:uncharacterized protein n=1 Tax=Fusarium solani TaxID=169388 RepID=UPI0032C3DDAF|nr:hypothetical protein MRS44_015269 [Fusarium solani]
MATNAKDGFTRALDGFRTTLTPEQQKDFSFDSLQDVQIKIKSIQDRYGPEKKLRNMQRLSKFLAGMKQVEELVTIFLNVHEVVAFVWGPIKFALMIASNRLETLELLLDTYVEIGEVIPSLRQYELIFKNYPYLREVLESCFHDILEFHKEALDVFTRTGWKAYLDSAWRGFKTRCKPIIDSLKRHRTLLSDEKLTAAIIEVQQARREAQELRNVMEARFGELSRRLETDSEKRSRQEVEAMKDGLLQARCTISSQLSPGNYQDDQKLAFDQFFRSPSGDWVLQEPKFTEWLKGSNGQILNLHGMPGAAPLTTFAKDPRQWIAENLFQWMVLKSLPDCLATPRGGTIVLDGLDECQDEWSTRQEPQVIIDWIHQNLISEASSQGYPIRILVSSQHVDFLKKELTKHPGIRLDQDDRHLHNIQAYAKFKASEIQERFSLVDWKRDSIVEKVSASSNGFFLYARVVLDNLMDQGSEDELDEELDTQNFPANLEAAYERVVTRVLDHKNRPKKAAAASKILSWMTCAARPLDWREIQSLFCIDLERGECIPGRRRVDSCKALCSSLVEEELPDQAEGEVREPFVRLVHNTAGGYLVHTARINLLEAHASMALFCSQYLASQPFQDGPRAETIQEFAKTGYYGFLDYAMASWTHHLALVSKYSSSLQADTLSKLISQATRVLESYEISNSGSSGGEPTIQSLEDILKFLIETGAVKAFGLEGQSALSCAMEQDDHELVPLIFRAASDETKARFINSGELKSRVYSCLIRRSAGDNQLLQALLSLCDQISAESVPHSLKPENLLYSVISILDPVSAFEIILNWASSDSDAHGPTLGLTDATRPECNSAAEKRYALITKRYENNNTLLHVAVRNEMVFITRHLLHQLKQPDITATNASGNTPLHELGGRSMHSSRTSEQDIATLLVEADNDAAANMKNNHGQLPIHLACENCQAETVVVLISHTHDLNSKDSKGNTVLMNAVKRKMIRVVEALLETKRVELCIRNRNGDTASDLALQQTDTGILQLLQTCHHVAVPRKGPMELFGKNPFDYCIKSQQWLLLARIEKLLDPDMHDAWSRLKYQGSAFITAEIVRQLLSFGCFLSAKTFLSSGKLCCPGSELGNLWILVEGQEEDELRALVLLQGEFPQDVWNKHLPLVKKLLQNGSPDSALLRLVKVNWYARHILTNQAEAQGCEELLGLLPPPQGE